ncbi:hypothetical protein GCM10009727_52960 [Actinomadura napierensis]|uniref:Uncharacterized protein n=1 Tax=Actinomadura napierensis TaxID=267854 RepID=A0ABP5LMX1_9ACTN
MLLLAPDERSGTRGIDEPFRSRSSCRVTGDGRPETRDLFWRLAGAWTTSEVPPAPVPVPGATSVERALHLGMEDPEHTTGWALTDTLWWGLAVLCRLGAAYRMTSDLDTVNRRTSTERPPIGGTHRFGGSPQRPLRRVRLSLCGAAPTLAAQVRLLEDVQGQARGGPDLEQVDLL